MGQITRSALEFSMTLAEARSEVKMADQVYCELYLMKSKDSEEHTLLYGYGQFDPSSCRSWRVDDHAGHLPVLIARATLSRSDADALLTHLQGAASFSLDLGPARAPLMIRGVERVRRSPVLRRPRMNSGAFDAAFGNRLCDVVELWNLDKAAVLADLTAGAMSDLEQVEHLHELIHLIAGEVGRDFKARAYEALGNFELFTVRPHLYQQRAIRDDRGRRIGISIEVDSAHPGVGERLSVAVSLGNARITVHSSMREWRRGEKAALEFRAAEPFSWAEVIIYGENGDLVDQARHVPLRGVSLTGSVRTGRKTVQDAWSRQVESKASKRHSARFGKTNDIDVVGHVMSTRLGEADPEEPWQRIVETRPPLFEVDAHARDTYFLPKKTAEEEVMRFETIRSLFDAEDVTRAICVDQYFGKKSLPLLARVRNRCSVEVVTRVKPSELEEMFALLRQKQTLVTTPLTVRRPAQEFHDRFLVVERGSIRELFVLSNSYSPVESNHPIILVRASGLDSLRILEYIDDLRKDAVTHWPEKPAKPAPPSDLNEEVGGAIVAGLLGSATSNPRALVASAGTELWSRLKSYLAISPPTAVVQLALEFLGGHSIASEMVGALGEADRATVATLQRMIEATIAGFDVPYRLRHTFHIPIESWIEILRALASVLGESSPVEGAIAAATLSVRREVHYGLNLGLRLLAAWEPRVFIEVIEAHLERAQQELRTLTKGEDPTLSRAVVTGVLVLRELMAFMSERDVLEAMLGAPSELTRRLALVALFAHPEAGREQIERGLAARVDREDLVWALLPLCADGDTFSEEDRVDMLATSIDQIDQARIKVVLRQARFDLAKQIGDRLATSSPDRASMAYAVVHESFEERLHACKLEHFHVSHRDLEHLKLARDAVRYRSEIGAVDLPAHIVAVVRKAGKRVHLHGFFRPRKRILDHSSWSGGLRLMQLAALYFVSVCEELRLSEPQRANLIQLASELVPFLEASPGLDERDPEHASVRVSAGRWSVSLDHALSEVRALQARFTE
jgi:hypothetical protein